MLGDMQVYTFYYFSLWIYARHCIPEWSYLVYQDAMKPALVFRDGGKGCRLMEFHTTSAHVERPDSWL